MNHVFDDPEILARLVACDVFSELTQIKVVNGFHTDLGVQPIVCDGPLSIQDIYNSSAFISLSFLRPDIEGRTLKNVTIHLMIKLALKSNSAQITLDAALLDIKRVLDVSLKSDRKGRRPHSVIKYCTVEAIAPIMHEVGDGVLHAGIDLRIGVAQKGATK